MQRKPLSYLGWGGYYADALYLEFLSFRFWFSFIRFGHHSLCFKQSNDGEDVAGRVQYHIQS